MERAAAPRLAGCVDGSAHQADEFARDRQTKPCASVGTSRRDVGLGEGLGIDFLQDDLAVTERRVFGKQVAHALGIGFGLRVFGGDLLRIEKFQRNRLLQLGDDVARAARQRELTVLGQVEPRIRQPGIGGDVDRHEDDDRKRDRGERIKAARQRLHRLTRFSSNR